MLAQENKIENKFNSSKILENFPNAKLHIIADTGLPAEKDHNYKFYRDSFKRVIDSHKKKIKNYKANHNHHKIIFFVFDESSAYIQCNQKTSLSDLQIGQIISTQKPHFWFQDKAFLNVLKDSEIDYLIWYAPYKLINTNDNKLDFPKAVILKTNELPDKQIEYDENLMISVEQ